MDKEDHKPLTEKEALKVLFGRRNYGNRGPNIKAILIILGAVLLFFIHTKKKPLA